MRGAARSKGWVADEEAFARPSVISADERTAVDPSMRESVLTQSVSSEFSKKGQTAEKDQQDGQEGQRAFPFTQS